MNQKSDFKRIIGEEYSWLNEIAGKAGYPDKPEIGYSVLRGVLHVIRDMLHLHEVFYLSARLPLFIRGVYFEGYDPQKISVMLYNNELLKHFRNRMGPGNSQYFEEYLHQNPPDKIDGNEFLNRVSHRMDLGDRVKPEDAFMAVLEVLHTQISAGEMDDIKGLMHNNVRELLA